MFTCLLADVQHGVTEKALLHLNQANSRRTLVAIEAIKLRTKTIYPASLHPPWLQECPRSECHAKERLR